MVGVALITFLPPTLACFFPLVVSPPLPSPLNTCIIGLLDIHPQQILTTVKLLPVRKLVTYVTAEKVVTNGSIHRCWQTGSPSEMPWAFLQTLSIPPYGPQCSSRGWPVPFTTRLRSERRVEPRDTFSVDVRGSARLLTGNDALTPSPASPSTTFLNLTKISRPRWRPPASGGTHSFTSIASPSTSFPSFPPTSLPRGTASARVSCAAIGAESSFNMPRSGPSCTSQRAKPT